jgi:hypothetical protein
MHLADTEQISFVIDWHKLEKNTEQCEFYFVKRDSNQTLDQFGEVFLPNESFYELNKIDSSGRQKYQPMPQSQYSRLAYVSYKTTENIVNNPSFHFNNFAVIQESEIDEFSQYTNEVISINTGLYVNIFELICQTWGVDRLKINLDDLLITNNEIERFELTQLSKNSPPDAKSLIHQQSTYRTSWLDILDDAKQNLFPDDRQLDPKKESVVEWINNHAKSKGITPSDNVAKAIFTIIKPNDHDPKKRKG